MKRKVKIIVGLLVVLAVVITAGFMTKKWWAGADVISNNPLKTAQTDLSQSSIVKVKIPAGVTKKDIENIAKQKNKDKSKEDLLNNAVEQKFDELEPQIAQIEKAQGTTPGQNQNSFQDYIIVYTDENDNPILPDAEKDQSFTSTFQDREKNELTFTWDSSWDAVDQNIVQDLKEKVKLAYPKMKEIYGQPAFNNQVKIKYDKNLYTSYYLSGTNEIVTNFWDDEIIIHEIAHAFRDDYCIMSNSPWEEGMATLLGSLAAITLNIPGDYYSPSVWWEQYENWNRPDISLTEIGYNPNYFLASATWLKPYIEDTSFLVKLNKKYYAYRRQNPGSYDYFQILPSMVATIKPEVEKEPFLDWYQKQYIFHQTSDDNYQLGAVIYGTNLIDFRISYTKSHGGQTVTDGVKIDLYDFNDKLIHTETIMPIFNGYNNKYIYKVPMIDPIIKQNGYDHGRFKLELSAKAESDQWKLKSTNYFFYYDRYKPGNTFPEPAIYGFVDSQLSEKVKILCLSCLNKQPKIVPVENGVFMTDSFQKDAGLFQISYLTNDDQVKATKYFTKYNNNRRNDVPNFFISITKDNQKPQLNSTKGRINNTSAKFKIQTNKKATIYFTFGINQAELKDYILGRILTEPNKDKFWTIQQLEKNTTYYYQFWAIDMNGNITKTDIKSFKTTNEVSPIITNASPADGTKNVSVDISQISLQFDKSLDPKTVNQNDIYLEPTAGMGEGGGPNIPLVDSQVSYDETAKKIIVKPKEKLQNNVEYGLFFSEVTDTKGNLVESFDYVFTTQIVPGSTKPKINSVNPQPKSEGSPLNSKIEIEFNVKIKPDDLNSIFWVNARNVTEQIEGTTQLVGGKKLVFTPSKPLPKNRLIYVNASFNFKDEAGNWIIPYYKYWKFRTGEN